MAKRAKKRHLDRRRLRAARHRRNKAKIQTKRGVDATVRGLTDQPTDGGGERG